MYDLVWRYLGKFKTCRRAIGNLASLGKFNFFSIYPPDTHTQHLQNSRVFLLLFLLLLLLFSNLFSDLTLSNILSKMSITSYTEYFITFKFFLLCGSRGPGLKPGCVNVLGFWAKHSHYLSPPRGIELFLRVSLI